MPVLRRLFVAALCVLANTIHAQPTIPAVTQAIPNRTLLSAGTAITVDLEDHFNVPGVVGPVVQYDTVLGKFNVELHSQAAPQHVANFLNYVQAGAYTNTFLHRSASLDGGAISILQGGGFTWSGSSAAEIFEFNPVPLEYNLPNARGTLAAARTSNINSATSQWYFNVRDNSAILGPANGGGYTVFGRVLGSGMTVVDGFATWPRVDAGVPFNQLPVRNYVGGTYTAANLAIINSITPIPVYPNTTTGTSLILFSGANSAPTLVNASLAGSSLILTPLAAGGATVNIRARDVNGNAVESSFIVTVASPLSRSVAAGTDASFLAPAGATAYQWQLNGIDIATATTQGLNLSGVQPSNVGLLTAHMTSGTGTTTSRAAILGITSSVKLVGAGTEFPDIYHPLTTFTYDQILLQGSAASVRADAGQILRISYVDLTDDIVQVEFSGPGTLTLALDVPTGPALPAKYNQNVSYMKGHAGIVLTGATADTHLTVFSVGRAVPGSNPALYRDNETYDGVAHIAFIAITSADGRFGGLRAANARFLAVNGHTGVYAPDVEFTGPVYVGDIDASESATPVLSIGSGSDVRITGGDLLQTNGRAVQVSGISQLKFTAGSTSHGALLPVQTNQGRLEQDGVDVTSQLVVYP